MATKYIVNNLTGQTINNQQILQPYKVYTALLTQSGGDNTQGLSSGAVTKGVTYSLSGIEFPPSPWDFSNVGGPVYPDITPFVATSNDVPNSYGTASLAYNTGTPVVTVLENTIGNIYWTYDDVGIYLAQSSGLFTLDKTFSLTTLFTGSPVVINSFRSDDNIFGINCNELDSPYSAINLNGVLQIEIRVYN